MISPRHVMNRMCLYICGNGKTWANQFAVLLLGTENLFKIVGKKFYFFVVVIAPA